MAQTIFAYAHGLDLDAVADELTARFDALAAERTWILKDVWVVNQREPAAPAPATEWDLGFNLTLPAKRPAAWVDDVVAIAEAMSALHTKTGRTFVIGIHDEKSGAQDLVTIASKDIEVDGLRDALAKATSKKRP